MRKKGFTIIELLISMAMLLTLLMVIFMVYNVGNKMMISENSRTDLMIEGSRAVDSLTKELREARTITTSEARSITFWRDLNGNSTMEANEIIKFSWSGTSGDRLKRTVLSTQESTLSNYVQNFQLTYDNPSNIKLITMTLRVGQGTETMSFEASVRPRNL
jgi:prepilin-type N-terminal cleavage/methylation domain-containing protein